MVSDIPGCQIGAYVQNDLDAREHARKGIEVSLIGEAFSIDVVVTPFDTLFAPPFDDRNTGSIVSGANPTDIVGSEFSQFLKTGRVTMRNNADRRVLHALINDLRSSTDQQVSAQ